MSKFFYAYYYSLEATGNAEVDAILEAVASASKAYHHTQDWEEEVINPIQDAARQAAARIVALINEGAADKRRLDWLERNNVAIHDRGGSSQLIRFEIFRDQEIQQYGESLREAIDAAIEERAEKECPNDK